MRKILLLLVTLFTLTSVSYSQITVTGSSNADGSYTTLSAAFAAFDATTTGTVTIDVSGNTTEPATGATLVAGAWTSITIAPTGGPWTISGAATAGTPLINFNGADNVTFNGGGSLIIENTTVSATSGTSTLKLVGDATNNTFNGVTFLGSGNGIAGTNTAVVWISTGTATGNDNNLFQNCKFGPAGSNLPSQCIVANGSTTSTAIENSNITINNCEFYDYFLPGGSSAAIYMSSGNTAWTITNNKIFQTTSRTLTAGSTHYGIYCVNSGATATGSDFTITGNTIGYANNSGTGTMTYAAAALSGGFTGINFNATSTALTTNNINDNVISNIQWTSTGSSAFYGINSTSYASTTSGNILNLNNNQVKNINWVTATGQVTAINAGYSPATSVSNNTIDNISRSGAGTYYLIQYTGTSSSSHTFNANSITNITSTSTTSTNAFYGIYSGSSPATEIFTNNTLNSFSSSSTAAQNMYGIYNLTATTGNKTCTGNTVSNLSLAASSTGTIYGIRIGYLGATNTIANNTIYNLNNGTTVYGLYLGTSYATSATSNIYQNKIYNIATASTSATSAVRGLGIAGSTSGITFNVYNNLIGNLTAPASANTDAIRGLSLEYTGTTSTINAYYNSIYLNATSTGANFGISALYHTANATATTAALNARNNIFVNVSTPKGTGKAAAYRRSAVALNNYANTSNNNMLYAGTPSVDNVIFFDGTNSDQTIGDFKTRMATRDGASATENVAWQSTDGSSPDFLKYDITIPSQIESGAANIATYTTDYTGTIRQGNPGYVGTGTAPDLGAWELEGIGLDLTPPVISYTALGNGLPSIDQTLTATITDASGVPTSGIGLPVLYYKVNAGAYTPVTASYGGGNSYSFTFGSAATTVGDVVSYYIVAQDMAGTPNIGAYPGGGAGGFTADPPYAATPPTTPSSYTIAATYSGTYTVGTGGTYTTLKAFFDAINGGVVTGNITANVVGNATETATAVLNQWTEYPANSNFTMTIHPDGGSPKTITGSIAGAIIKLNGADRVTIDGLNTGGNSLTISNTNTSTSGAVIWLGSASASNGATYNTIKNCTILGNASVTTLSGIVSSSGTTMGATAEAANRNNSYTNNIIKASQYGISLVGVTGNETANIITGNTIGGALVSDQIGYRGIFISQQDAATITGNTITGVITATTSTASGIYVVGTQSGGTMISKNIIYNIKNTNTGGYGSNGIDLASSSANANLYVVNNFIYDVASYGYSSGMSETDNGYGIILQGGGGYNIYHNTIRLTTNQTTGKSAALNITSNITTPNSLDIRNNIFATTQTTNTRYAIYYGGTSTGIFLFLNNNDYYAPGGTLGYLSSDKATLGDIKTAFTQNGASQNVDPMFVSNTDLHINSGVTPTALESGGANVGIVIDIDGDTRPGPTGSVNGGATAADIGADEFDGVPYAPCPAPTAQPTVLTISTVTNISASGSFTAAAPAPTNYLVVRTTANSLGGLPVDGVAYSVGANPYFGAGGYVESVSSTTNINSTGLAASTTYYYWIFSYNTGTCSNTYLTTSPLTGNITTCAAATGAPGTPTGSNITTTQFDATWTASSTPGVNYIIDVATDAGFTSFVSGYQALDLGLGTLTTTISGLSAATNYYVRVRAVIGGCFSPNTSTLSVTTLCNAVSTYPYSEGFNAASLPTCWTAYEGAPGASYHWQPVISDASYGAGSPAEGSHFLRMYYYLASTTYNPYYLKSIPFDLGATAKRAKFAIWMGINSGANNLKFEVSADGGLTWTTLSTYSANPANNNSSAPWENKTVDLSAYTNQTVIFRLNAISSYGSGYTDIGFDNFVVENIPACAEPTALSAGSITTSSASISFIGAGTAYILEYGAPGFTPGTDNNAGVGGTIVTGSASPIAISGLTSNTTYDVYVRQDCTGDGNGYSPNSAKATFTTLCNTTNVPYTQNFESALVPALPACTSQEQLGLGNTWVTVSNPGNGFTSNTLKYTYNTDNPANVWFYTQGVNLTVGTYYTISYRYGNNSTTYAPEKLKVAYGTSPSNGAMNNTLADHPNINQAAAQSNTVSFTPPSTGVYYFGFKAYSDADKFYLYVDDIVVDVAPWTWTGTTNTDWGTASNWDLGSVPTSTSNVIIPNVANKPVVGAGTYAAKNATINTGSSLTINGTLQVNGNITNNATITGAGSLALNGITAQTFNVGTVGATIASFSLNNTAGATLSGTGKLNVTDVLTVQDGSTLTTGGVVVLKSDASNTARLAPVGTGIISGDVTVERFIPAKASRSWSLLSSPITQSLQNSWQQQIHITGAGTGGTICPTPTAHSNGFDASGTNAPSAYTYDASQAQGSRWQAVSNTNATNVGQGKGFRVNVRGPRSLGCDLLNGVNMVPSAATLSATGTLSNSDKNLGSFSITYPNNGTNNWVMVGNPYPSALNYVTLQGDNGTQIDDAYAIYIPGNAPGTYSYWSDADGFFTGGTGYDNGKGNTIASGQAVFFKSIVAGIVSLDFNEAQKDVDGTAGYFRNNRRTINEKVKVSFGTTDKKIDEVVVRYANDATVSNTAISKMDIPSMNSGTYITSLKGNKPMVVQTRALNTLSTDEVWLNIGATQSGNYTFNFSDYENFAGTEIYLVDHLAKATQNIKENPTYVFSVDVNNAATKGSERFSLVFNRNAQPSVVYNTIKMYPNPANKQVTFLLPQSADISYNIKVTDMAGKIVLQHKAAGGTEQMSVDKLTTGTYIVEIIDNKGNRTTEKLIKN